MDIWSSPEAAMEYARHLAKATLGASEFRNASNVLMAMEIGRSYNLSPAVSMMNIHIIPTSKGPTPTLTANMMQSQALKAGHFIHIKSTKSKVVGRLIRGDFTPERIDYLKAIGFSQDEIREMCTFEEVWDERRAMEAKLLGKDNWGLYQEDMMRARVKAGLIRMGCPEVLMGNLYTPDELGAITDREGTPLMADDGTVIMGEVVRSTTTRSPRKASPAKKAATAPEPEPVDAEIEEDEEQETASEAEEAPAAPGSIDPQQVVDYALAVAQDEAMALQERAETLGTLLKQSDEFALGDAEIVVGDSEATLREALLAISKPVMIQMHQQAKQTTTA